FEPIGDLPAFHGELRLRSRARLERSPKYTTYTNLLAQIEERQRAPEISLKLDTRLALAESERELHKALEEKIAGPDEGTEETKRPDFALEESCQVLCDWLSLRENIRAVGTHRPDA